MGGMTPEQALFLLHEVYLGALKNEGRTTKKVLEAVPAEMADHRPDSVSRTAIELVRHIAAADNRFLECAINGVLDTNAAMIPDTVKTPQQIAAWYEERFLKNFDALKNLSGEQLVKMVDFRNFLPTCAAWGLRCLPSTAKASTTPKRAKPRAAKR